MGRPRRRLHTGTSLRGRLSGCWRGRTRGAAIRRDTAASASDPPRAAEGVPGQLPRGRGRRFVVVVVAREAVLRGSVGRGGVGGCLRGARILAPLDGGVLMDVGGRHQGRRSAAHHLQRPCLLLVIIVVVFLIVVDWEADLCEERVLLDTLGLHGEKLEDTRVVLGARFRGGRHGEDGLCVCIKGSAKRGTGRHRVVN